MIKQLKRIRNTLLEFNLIDVYKNIMYFFDEPNGSMIEMITNNLPVELRASAIDVFTNVVDIYELDRPRYRNEIIYGQRIIWSEVLDCYKSLLDVKRKLLECKILVYEDDYLKANNELKRAFSYYAEVQVQMSRFEDVLGIDRYLDTLSNSDIKPLEALAFEIKDIFEKKIEPYKNIFVEKWNTTNIQKIILHELIRYDGNNQTCTLFDCNKKKIILFIIDGFGYSQYQWHKTIHKDTINYTYNENIFAWLEKVGCIQEYTLGSSFVTDTGAGLSQIFIGKSAKETGIISSKLSKDSNNTLIQTKKLDINTFQSLYCTEINSITEVISAFGKESNVFYGSRYNKNNISGFSDFIFKGANIKEILPSERMFSILKEDLYKEKSGLDVAYLTGIDNSGHTMGAYSKFEKFEHEKFNMLFRNFLIELSIERPDLFDNNTTFIITADHGMSESSKLMISRKVIKDKLFAENIRGVNLIENNRAMLVYGIRAEDYNKAFNCLNDYFAEINTDTEILIKGTEEYDKYYCTDLSKKISCLSPDMVIRLISNGLFYSKETSQYLLHYGGHGGGSAGEIFVPLLQIALNNKLLNNIRKRFTNIM